MVTSSPGLIAGSYVLHRLLTPRHPSHALDDLIASTECRPQPIARLVLVRIRSWPHLHGGASGRQCLSCSTCSRLRCSFLGAITHCTSGQLGTAGNPAVSDISSTRSIATFCTLSSLVKDRSSLRSPVGGSQCGGARIAISKILSMPLLACAGKILRSTYEAFCV